jgi:hypothetical protein
LLEYLRQGCLGNRNESPSKNGTQSGSYRRYKYTKVLDNRKHPIRGLWRRDGNFLARISPTWKEIEAVTEKIRAELKSSELSDEKVYNPPN